MLILQVQKINLFGAKMKLNEKLGEKIRCIREIQGLTQQNMADALGITNTAYAKMERGETKIKPERL
jgi:DNA-binding XRE family transcriptional regulator